MSEPALKCENNYASFKQTWTKKLFIAFKMFQRRGKSRFF